MEQVIAQVIDFILQLAARHEWVSTVCLIVGGLYILLSLLRGALTMLVKLTKTNKDDKVIAAIFAFLDKYAWGFGKFADYYEQHKPQPEQDKK